MPPTVAAVAAAMSSPNSSTSSSSSPFQSPSVFPSRSPPNFTPIPEHDREEDDDVIDPVGGPAMPASVATAHHHNPHHQPEQTEEKQQQRPSTVDAGVSPYKHQPTPSNAPCSTSSSAATNKTMSKKSSGSDRVVNCNKCRPSSREKISVVPLDRLASTPSPAANLSFSTSSSLRGFLSNLTRRSPRPSTVSTGSAVTSWPTPGPAPAPPQTPQNYQGHGNDEDDASNVNDNSDDGHSTRQNEWRQTAAELSRKLLHATRRRDEAALEASRLRRSVTDLEKKLARLEMHCHDLSSSLQRYASERAAAPAAAAAAAAAAVAPSAAGQMMPPASPSGTVSSFFPLDAFLRAISDARAAVRHLARALSPAAVAGGNNNVSTTATSKSFLILSLESQLSRALYEDFESAGFDRSSSTRILDPYASSESSRAAYESLKGLAWDEVVARGTRHYSEGLSRFCDRKMAEVVGILGWGARPWPEPMLQAFFGAAKHAWLLHLLARSAHPAVPLFRVEKGVRFDPIYMEEAVGSTAELRVRRMGVATAVNSAVVRAMVAPGFYVGSSVVKCKVVCSYDD